MTDNAANPHAFVPLADFETPAMPAEEIFRRYLGRLLALLRNDQAKPFIAADQLLKATAERLNEVVAPPACGPLLTELDETIELWRAERPAVSHLKMIVLPPCDQNDVVRSWAEQAGHRILATPPRSNLIDPLGPEIPDLAREDSILVVPRLEEWFLRHQDGLQGIRKLLAALQALERPVVVGCNSWAWTFLRKATGADYVLPDAVTFLAFDETRLHGWFSELGTAEATGQMRFRLPQSGEDVLAQDETGKPKSDYLKTLAGHSLGIPWIAWHLWRRSLRSSKPESSGGDAAAAVSGTEPSEQTLWVAALDEFVLPGIDEQTALLVLHALLIHGPLSAADLRLVLPTVGESNILPTLTKAGFLERRGDLFSCRPAAYPAIRNGLISAGYSKDGF